MTQSKIRSSAQVLVDANFDFATYKGINLGAPTEATDAATKGYVDDAFVANDAMVFKGMIDASTNPDYPNGNAGDTYKVSVAGKIGGVDGADVSVGDLIICGSDNTDADVEGVVGESWYKVHVGEASTAQTADRVIISNGSGAVTTDSKLTWNNTYKRLEVGTSCGPSSSGDALMIGSEAAGAALAQFSWHATFSSYIKGFRARGTAAAPTAVQANDDLLRLRGAGCDGVTTFQGQTSSVDIKLIANQEHSLTAKGTRIEFATVADDSTALTNRLTIENNGDLNLEGAGNTYNINGSPHTHSEYALPTFVTREAITGTKDGENATFSLANTPTVGSEMLFLNGLLLNPGEGIDYTISGGDITMLVIPVATDVLLATYRF